MKISKDKVILSHEEFHRMINNRLFLFKRRNGEG